jgi:CRP-like cAMP-binding protein/phosphoribosyl 1,2-cyclic phosphodiesterase
MSEIISLPRGGLIVDTPVGYVQFGSPPETIKDSMFLPNGVPQIFVLPSKFFNWIKGISVAEVEFPLYYNFFLKQRKTYIICQKEQYPRFITGLTEALFGPQKIHIAEDFPEGYPAEKLPPIENEVAYFRGSLNVSDLVEFIIFEDGRVNIKGLSIQLEENGFFSIIHEGTELAKVPSSIEYVPTYDIGTRLPEPFQPPRFGVTCLGPSHGFDPEENTSGFIIWLNGQGIMVDPPVNTTEWLIDSNVNPKLIDSIIVTHCHADHDAGTLQKILEEGKIKVYTTKTVISSFVRKYGALTDVSTDYLHQLFDFHEIRIQKPLYIHGGRFMFYYTLHSIPTIAFTVKYDGKKFVYSSDHNNDPDLHKKLLDDNWIHKQRYEDLTNFPWNADYIYHEAGIPPLHTPVTVLDSKPKNIKKRITVYHIAKKDFPQRSALNLATFGIEHTLDIPVQAPEYEKYYHILGLLRHLDFFQDIPISKAQEFLSIVQEEAYKRGETIIREGTPGDKFYIIKSGNVSVPGEDLEQRKIYSLYDYFGEAALLTDKLRSADVIAETDVTLYTIKREKFLNFIERTELKRTLERLSKIRDTETWNVLSTTPFFRPLTSTQKTFLESLLHPVRIEDPGVIVEETQTLDRVYIIRNGSIDVFKGDKQITTIGRGDFIGAMVKVHRGESAWFTFKNKTPVDLYYIEKEDVLSFLDRNPGLIMKLVYDFMME